MSQLAADARNRAARSLLQGLAIDVLTAAAAALLLWLPDADLTSRDAWIVLGTGMARTVLGSVASWVMRLKLDGSPIPTPLPPGDPGEPDAEAGSIDVTTAVLIALLVLLVLIALGVVGRL